MPELIVDAVELLGWLGIFAVMIVLAPEAVMPFLGYAVYQAELNPVTVLAAASLGATLGSTLIYLVVRAVGDARARRWVRRGSRWYLIQERDLEVTHRVFRRHGAWIVLFGRFVPTVRSLVSIPAGLLPMRLVPFLLLTLLGTTLWNGVLLAAGYATGSNWARVEAYLGTYGTVVTLLLLVAVAGLLLYRLRNLVLRHRRAG
ncbi:DedA family protein [Halorhodospira halophila]|uniref:Alkaline phosphatase n=1 Tax=Halorhodospira halophila (strain DSM 244 / SL1) TaxID=349124 RepID=A1WV05_HALHL|nr:DedA family protein [Halorhodospira halophila]ABM61517.1 alkaline phosphatase [Halorhodospira halophila SL1]MBK1728765.1 DedA family protein [Halorhodospira halophila]